MIQDPTGLRQVSRTAPSAGLRRRRYLLQASLLMVGAVSLSGCLGGGSTVAIGEGKTLSVGEVGNPTVAVHQDGTHYVAWVEIGAEGGDVYLSAVRPDGEPATEPVRVNDIPGDADPHEQAPPQVEISPDGSVLVVWQRKVEAPWLDFGGADLRLARSIDGGRSFLPAVTVNDNASTSPVRISFHDITSAPDGTILVSWIDARVRDSAREHAYHEGISHGHGAGGMPSLEGEPGTEIRLAISHDGGASFSKSLVVDGDTCPCCRTSVAVGPDGAIYLGWRKVFNGQVRDIAVARSTDGGQTFEEPLKVHDDDWEYPGCPHAGPSLAVGDDGRLHVSWYTGRPDRQGLWYAVSDDRGDSFSEPIAILTDSFVPASQARLALVDDEVWVAWDDLRTDTPKVGFGTIADGRLRVHAGEFEGHAPSLSAAGRTGALAWLDRDEVRLVGLEASTD